MWPVENVQEHDLGTPEGLAWWDSLTEAQREEWRKRVKAAPEKRNGEIVLGIPADPTPDSTVDAQ